MNDKMSRRKFFAAVGVGGVAAAAAVVATKDGDAALVVARDAEEHLDEGGLAGTILADEPEAGPLRHGDGDAADGVDAAEALLQFFGDDGVGHERRHGTSGSGGHRRWRAVADSGDAHHVIGHEVSAPSTRCGG
jgi:hypothetical protein